MATPSTRFVLVHVLKVILGSDHSCPGHEYLSSLVSS